MPSVLCQSVPVVLSKVSTIDIFLGSGSKLVIHVQ